MCSIVRVLCSKPAAARDVPVRVPGKTFVFKGGDSGVQSFRFGAIKVYFIGIFKNKNLARMKPHY